METAILDEFDVPEPQPADEDIESEGTITQPFDPAKIRVETKQLSMDTLLSRIENREIVLQPEFQRMEVWRDKARSRLIESILIRIPLPAFYMDATDDDKWLVVDGQQRLSTLERFVLKQDLKLQHLEFLREFDGFKFDQLPRAFQRRIRETNVTVYLIERGTPPAVKINIFKRINTGGLPLSPQEIRHALNGDPVATMLKELAASKPFQTATNCGVPSERMTDREYVLRFLAFILIDPNEFASQEFDSFLSDTMARINQLDDPGREDLKRRFLRSMAWSLAILGRLAFRKFFTLDKTDRLRPLNKALFEAWSVNFDRMTDNDLLTLSRRQDQLLENFTNLIDSRDFEQSISQSTGDVQRVRLRFAAIREIIGATLA